MSRLVTCRRGQHPLTGFQRGVLAGGSGMEFASEEDV